MTLQQESIPPELLTNLERLHTTPMGIERIGRNLSLPKVENPIAWCRRAILAPGGRYWREGKNWYILADGCKITVNASSYTVITAHRVK